MSSNLFHVTSKKSQKSSVVIKVSHELCAYYRSKMYQRLKELDTRIDQLVWVVTENDQEEKCIALREMNGIKAEINEIDSRYKEFKSLLLSLSVDNVDSKVYNYVPNEVVKRIVAMSSPRSTTDPSNTICSKCKRLVKLLSKITQCPYCYEDLKNGDTFTLNENTFKSDGCRKSTLDEAMDAYEGVQKRTFRKDFITYIDNTLAERNIDPSKVSKETLRMTIKRGRFSEYFSDLNLLHKIYTGASLPNLSHLRDKLRQRNMLMKEVYMELHPGREEGKKCLHGQFLLKILLQMEGYKYDKSFFSSELKMRVVAMRHNREAEEVCKILRVRYPDMKWDFAFTI